VLCVNQYLLAYLLYYSSTKEKGEELYQFMFSGVGGLSIYCNCNYLLILGMCFNYTSFFEYN